MQAQKADYERAFPLTQAGELPRSAIEFFHCFGFVVVRGVVPRDRCEAARETFLRVAKPYDGLLMRQTTTRLEHHNISEQGLMTNPILDFHKIDVDSLGGFRRAGLDVLSEPKLAACLRALMHDDPVLVQTMYFESSRGTDPHMDAHFIDSTRPGSLIGCWIALEAIHPEGGRFTFYPGSHRLDDPDAFDDAVVDAARAFERHSVDVIQGYQLDHKSASLTKITKQRRLLRRLIKASQLEPYTPELDAGDLVFFGSKVIHASLKPGFSGYTRHSVTAHFVPASTGIRRSGSEDVDLEPKAELGLAIHVGA